MTSRCRSGYGEKYMMAAQAKAMSITQAAEAHGYQAPIGSSAWVAQPGSLAGCATGSSFDHGGARTTLAPSGAPAPQPPSTPVKSRPSSASSERSSSPSDDLVQSMLIGASYAIQLSTSAPSTEQPLA